MLKQSFRRGFLAVAAAAISTGSLDGQEPRFEPHLRMPASANQSEPAFHMIGTLRFHGSDVLVFDHLNTSVRLFDTRGRLLDEFGGRGEGPGEFSYWTMRAGVSEQGFWVSDPTGNQRVTWFDARGEVSATRPVPELEPGEADVRNIRVALPVRHDQTLVETVDRDPTDSGPL